MNGICGKKNIALLVMSVFVITSISTLGNGEISKKTISSM